MPEPEAPAAPAPELAGALDGVGELDGASDDSGEDVADPSPAEPEVPWPGTLTSTFGGALPPCGEIVIGPIFAGPTWIGPTVIGA